MGKANAPGTKDKYVPGLLRGLQAALLWDMITLRQWQVEKPDYPQTGAVESPHYP